MARDANQKEQQAAEATLPSSSRRMLYIAYAIVFVSSMCILVLELTAGRLIAGHLGASLYTWTSVIGVVLAGIAIGNWIGGKLADRFEPTRVLPTLYFVSSLLTFSILLINTYAAGWDRPDSIGWPYWVALNVFVIFFAPACALGTISPVVAKLALDQGWSTGQTVGNVYAWGTAGSIIGTFLTGFFLVEAFGTRQIVAVVAFVLLAIAIGLAVWWKRSTAGMTVAGLLMALLSLFAFASPAWAVERGISLNLRPDLSRAVYFDESNYFAITVYDQSDDVRVMALDDLIHGYINTIDPTRLEYDYAQVYEVITERLVEPTDSFETLTIGGGGYVFPRFLELTYPNSHQDVIEIDPKVKKAAQEAFLLPPDDETDVASHIGDARNVINDFVREGKAGTYEIVYLDAFNDFSVPWHLTTQEFNDDVASLMAPGGAYVVNLIDIFSDEHGKFLGAFVTTARETWDNIYILGTVQQSPTGGRETFIVVASDQVLDLDGLTPVNGGAPLVAVWEGTEMDFTMTNLMRHGRDIVLTDNWAPVDNLVSGLYTAD